MVSVYDTICARLRMMTMVCEKENYDGKVSLFTKEQKKTPAVYGDKFHGNVSLL